MADIYFVRDSLAVFDGSGRQAKPRPAGNIGQNFGRLGRTRLNKKEICHVREGRREFPEFRQDHRTFVELAIKGAPLAD